MKRGSKCGADHILLVERKMKVQWVECRERNVNLAQKYIRRSQQNKSKSGHKERGHGNYFELNEKNFINWCHGENNSNGEVWKIMLWNDVHIIILQGSDATFNFRIAMKKLEHGQWNVSIQIILARN